MIELKKLSKTYVSGDTKTLALKDIDLKINKGEFVAIMGKSTLVNIIGFMDNLTEGEYLFEGDLVNQWTQKKKDSMRKEKISFVFQNFALMSQYSVYENVEVPLLARGVRKSIRKSEIDNVLKELEIYDEKDKLPERISGGQQQRVAIARALVAGVPILIADEPTGALDEENGRRIMEIILELNKKGMTVIIVTHDKDVASYANRILELSDGKIINDVCNKE